VTFDASSATQVFLGAQKTKMMKGEDLEPVRKNWQCERCSIWMTANVRPQCNLCDLQKVEKANNPFTFFPPVSHPEEFPPSTESWKVAYVSPAVTGQKSRVKGCFSYFLVFKISRFD
jgi:hypothetical protein